MTLVAISGNMCTDKKPAAINWILGQLIVLITRKAIFLFPLLETSIVTVSLLF
jgi:hydroxymethylglutaryl-CoA reductase